LDKYFGGRVTSCMIIGPGCEPHYQPADYLDGKWHNKPSKPVPKIPDWAHCNPEWLQLHYSAIIENMKKQKFRLESQLETVTAERDQAQQNCIELSARLENIRARAKNFAQNI